jgi:hypothetical protein
VRKVARLLLLFAHGPCPLDGVVNVGVGVIGVGGGEVGTGAWGGSGVVGPWVGGVPCVSGGGVHVGMIDDFGVVVGGTVVDVVDGGGAGGDCDVHDTDRFAAPARIATTRRVFRIAAAGMAEPVGMSLNLPVGAQ